jgi:hypothetical protein
MRMQEILEREPAGPPSVGEGKGASEDSSIARSCCPVSGRHPRVPREIASVRLGGWASRLFLYEGSGCRHVGIGLHCAYARA